MRFKVNDLVTFDIWKNPDVSTPHKARVIRSDEDMTFIRFEEGDFKGDTFDVPTEQLKLVPIKSNPGFGSFWDDIAE